MSKRLEEFIKQNSEAFDDVEPKFELWQEIEAGLALNDAATASPATKTFSLGFVLRVAAIVMLVMAIGFIWYLKTEKTPGINLADINPEYAKQQVHYASLVESKRTELKTLAKTDPQLYREFSAEIAKMDSTYKKLNNDLANSPNQELVLRAMIRNLQIQTEVLNEQLQVIEQFNQIKKVNQDENIHI